MFHHEVLFKINKKSVNVISVGVSICLRQSVTKYRYAFAPTLLSQKDKYILKIKPSMNATIPGWCDSRQIQNKIN